MSFASPQFVFFLIAFLIGTLLLRGKALLLFSTIGAYVFYSGSYPPYTLLLFGTTAIDYFLGLAMGREERQERRRLYLAISLCSNLGLLAIYKYSGFVAQSINRLLETVGIDVGMPVPHLLLPIGISFYVFQSLSYTIDVYRRVIPAEKSFLSFAFYVSFFPHLVAGPIVRARDFLPQVEKHKPFGREDTLRGLELCVVGLFKKLVVADNCATFVEPVFREPHLYGGGAIWLASTFFAIQIYGDFSGYSDVARGLARILGLYIKPNFWWPYLSHSMSEFWRRWHMSLSYWLRDYLYISLGGSRVAPLKQVRNIAVTWFLSGLWHGAAWHFVFWGLYQGAVISAERLFERTRPGKAWERAPSLLRVPVLFAIVVLGWVLFRADSVSTSAHMWAAMFGWGDFWKGITLFGPGSLALVCLAGAVHVATWRAAYDIDTRSILLSVPYGVRIALIVGVMMVVVIFSGAPRDFIYFAF